ncbi:hypothetical protein Tco_1232452 [Tanacetum coccineum]
MFNEYFKLPSVVPITIFDVTLPPPDIAEASSSTSMDQDAPSPITSPTNKTTKTPNQSTNVEEPNNEDKDVEFDSDAFIIPFAPLVTSSAGLSSRIIDTSNMHTFQQPHSHIQRWTKDHPLVKLNEYGGVLKNKARLVAKGYRQTKNFLKSRGIFINQSKYALEMLKKYGLDQCDAVNTLMVERSKLDEDLKGTQVDPTHYYGMVGSLMYLIASHPDLVFVVCLSIMQVAKTQGKVHCRYVIYETLVNIQKQLVNISIRRIHIRNTTYPCPNFTKASMTRRRYTPYPRRPHTSYSEAQMNILEYYIRGAHAKLSNTPY